MNFKRTMVLTREGSVGTFDTIEYEGALWFVTKWMHSRSAGAQRPERIVRLDRHDLAPAPDHPGIDFLLQSPVPKSVFDMAISPAALNGYSVVDRPKIMFPYPGGLN